MTRKHAAVSAFVGILACAATPGAGGATLCVEPMGTGGCQTTIQAAVNLASPGDLVRISPGVYYESVSVDQGKDGLLIEGVVKATTILDGSPYLDKGIAGGDATLSISSSNVRVRSLTFRNGRIGISVGGAGIVLEGLRFKGTDNPVVTQAPGLQVLSCEFSACWGCVVGHGIDPVVRNSVLVNSSSGLTFQSLGGGGTERAQVIGNRMEGVSSPLTVSSAVEPVVRSNDIRHSGSVVISGTNPIVENNVVATGSGGLFVDCSEINREAGPADDIPADCSRSSIAGNTVQDTGGGLLVTSLARGLVVRHNRVLGGTGLAFNSSDLAPPGTGTWVTIERNRVSNAGFVGLLHDGFRGYCFGIFGGGAHVAGNTAMGCADAGFYVSGFENHLEANAAVGTAENGFTLDQGFPTLGGMVESFGNMLDRNTARLNAAQGIAILEGVSLTNLTGNTATRNRTDFCDDGSQTVLDGNTFGTTGPCAVLH